MAANFRVTLLVAQGMLNSTGLAEALDAGTAAVFRILTGTVPTNADDTETGTLLGTLTCSGTAFSGYSDLAPGARATFAAITSDSSADNTGTATYFRLLTQTGGTIIAQGTVGTSSADLILNTVAITSGSTISISAATIDLPEG
jgi:hypothetical protein